MLRRVFVRELDRVVDVVDEDAATPVVDGGARDLLPFELRQLPCERPVHFVREVVRRC